MDLCTIVTLKMITALKAHKWDYEKSVVLSDQAKDRFALVGLKR